MVSYSYTGVFLCLFCVATAFVVPSFPVTPRGSAGRCSAGSTTVFWLTPADKTDALADKFDKLVVEMKSTNTFLLGKIDVLTGQIVDLTAKTTVMAGDIGALKAESLERRRLDCGKDISHFTM